MYIYIYGYIRNTSIRTYVYYVFHRSNRSFPLQQTYGRLRMKILHWLTRVYALNVCPYRPSFFINYFIFSFLLFRFRILPPSFNNPLSILSFLLLVPLINDDRNDVRVPFFVSLQFFFSFVRCFSFFFLLFSIFSLLLDSRALVVSYDFHHYRYYIIIVVVVVEIILWKYVYGRDESNFSSSC